MRFRSLYEISSWGNIVHIVLFKLLFYGLSLSSSLMAIFYILGWQVLSIYTFMRNRPDACFIRIWIRIFEHTFSFWMDTYFSNTFTLIRHTYFLYVGTYFIKNIRIFSWCVLFLHVRIFRKYICNKWLYVYYLMWTNFRKKKLF